MKVGWRTRRNSVVQELNEQITILMGQLSEELDKVHPCTARVAALRQGVRMLLKEVDCTLDRLLATGQLGRGVALHTA